jgi:hypothetical protein
MGHRKRKKEKKTRVNERKHIYNNYVYKIKNKSQLTCIYFVRVLNQNNVFDKNTSNSTISCKTY